jgi:hypothetical protein
MRGARRLLLGCGFAEELEWSGEQWLQRRESRAAKPFATSSLAFCPEPCDHLPRTTAITRRESRCHGARESSGGRCNLSSDRHNRQVRQPVVVVLRHRLVGNSWAEWVRVDV